MIANDQELNATLERIRHLQAQVDRMQLEVREYLSLHPAELKARV